MKDFTTVEPVKTLFNQ